MSAAEPEDEVEDCPICDVAFADADLCAFDVDLGCCHAACLDGADIVDLDTGAALAPNTPVFTLSYGQFRAGFTAL